MGQKRINHRPKFFANVNFTLAEDRRRDQQIKNAYFFSPTFKYIPGTGDNKNNF